MLCKSLITGGNHNNLKLIENIITCLAILNPERCFLAYAWHSFVLVLVKRQSLSVPLAIIALHPLVMFAALRPR